ncbi:MAG: SurA N-terminal domain-containing protein [Alphaproteobacteria bacterium]
MLTTMRRSVSGFFSKLLMLFLIITFAVWGVGDMLNTGLTGQSLASVGDLTISDAEFNRELQQVRERAGNQLPPEILDSEMFRAQVLNRMIEVRLLRLAAEDLELRMGENLIALETMQNQMFQNVDGRFNPDAFNSFLASQSMSEGQYRLMVGEETMQRLLFNSGDLDQLRLPPSFLTLQTLSATQMRRATIITLAAGGNAPPSNAELNEFYERIKTKEFLRPETRTLRYAVLAKDALTGRDEQARMDLGYQIEDAIAAGDSLTKALADSGIAAEEKNLNEISADGMQKNSAKRYSGSLIEAVLQKGFALEEGETSGLETTADGVYFLVSVVSIQAAEPAPLAAVKDEVIQRYRLETSAAQAKEQADKLKAALSAASDEATRQKLMAASGAKLRESGWLTRPVANSKVQEALPASLIEAIFEVQKNQVAGPVAQADGSYVLSVMRETKVAANAPKITNVDEKEAIAELANELANAWYQSLVARHPVVQHHAIPSLGQSQ